MEQMVTIFFILVHFSIKYFSLCFCNFVFIQLTVNEVFMILQFQRTKTITRIELALKYQFNYWQHMLQSL